MTVILLLFSYPVAGTSRGIETLFPTQASDDLVVVYPPNLTIEGCSTGEIAGTVGIGFSINEIEISLDTYLGAGGEISGGCEGETITYKDEVIEPHCPIIVRRTFTVVDTCGVERSGIQTITIETPPLSLDLSPAGKFYYVDVWCGDEGSARWGFEHMVSSVIGNTHYSGGCAPEISFEWIGFENIDWWSFTWNCWTEDCHEITWTIKDSCQEVSFITTVCFYSVVEYIVIENNVSYSACEFANQRELDSAFARWMCEFEYFYDNCGNGYGIDIESLLQQFSAPDLAAGGTTRVDYDLWIDCSGAQFTGKFEVVPPGEEGCPPDLVYVDLSVNQQNIDDCVGSTHIQEIAGGLNVRVFPNPGRGMFNLQIDNTLAGEAFSISIFESDGREVYSKEIVADDAPFLMRLNLSFLSPGSYIFHLQSKRARIIQQIVII